jgi:hypothetical protein
MLQINEKKLLKEIFLDQTIDSKGLKVLENDAKLSGQTFWSKLYNFVIRYRTTLIKEEDELLELWLYEVAPSCCYPKKNKGLMQFNCYFCESWFKRTHSLVRHYKEKHFEQIPKEIFGAVPNFVCKICDVKYVRKEFYERHLESDIHKQKAEGKPAILKNKKNHNKLKKESEIDEWERKRLKLEIALNDHDDLSDDDSETVLDGHSNENFYYSDEEKQENNREGNL